MSKTLYIHIGHYKTGTTALQRFLWDNREALLIGGVDYVTLGCTREKHNAYAVPVVFGFYRHDLIVGHKDPSPPEPFWEKLYAYVRASAAPASLISSEEFICVGERQKNIDALQRCAALAGDAIQVKVICYLRPPGSHLESWYNQLVKLQRPIGHRSRAIALEYDRVNVDYAKALRPWVDIFGADNVIIRGYDPAWRSGAGLFEDFCSLLPAPYPRDPVLPHKDVNPRIDDRTLELIRVLNRVGASRETISAHVARFKTWLEEMAPDTNVDEAAFEAAQRASNAGLDWVAALPGATLNLEEFRADPPRLRPDWDDYSSAVTEYVMSELMRHESANAPEEAPEHQRGS